ncbi:hypothetical protein [Streptomyces niveus]|uniref:hypothetical protein n=1 Tax=Streptomyces niveus TaxID=193462 RepID=UPI003F6502AE
MAVSSAGRATGTSGTSRTGGSTAVSSAARFAAPGPDPDADLGPSPFPGSGTCARVSSLSAPEPHTSLGDDRTRELPQIDPERPARRRSDWAEETPLDDLPTLADELLGPHDDDDDAAGGRARGGR